MKIAGELASLVLLDAYKPIFAIELSMKKRM